MYLFCLKRVAISRDYLKLSCETFFEVLGNHFEYDLFIFSPRVDVLL